MTKNIIYLFFFLSIGRLSAADYNASQFGCISDGVTNNTQSIQKAIDMIAEQGGGTLNFYVGRYLTGALALRSNVSIHLHEGAVLLASSLYYDMEKVGDKATFIHAEGQNNISITGKGRIVGSGDGLNQSVQELQGKGILPGQANLPALLYFKDCETVRLEEVSLEQAAGETLILENTQNITLANQRISSSQQLPVIQLIASTQVVLQDLFIKSPGEALVLDKASQVKQKVRAVKANGKSI